MGQGRHTLRSISDPVYPLKVWNSLSPVINFSSLATFKHTIAGRGNDDGPRLTNTRTHILSNGNFITLGRITIVMLTAVRKHTNVDVG